MCHPYIENKSHLRRPRRKPKCQNDYCLFNRDLQYINECGRLYAGLTGMIVYISESAMALSM